jgi:hypothetical protein
LNPRKGVVETGKKLVVGGDGFVEKVPMSFRGEVVRTKFRPNPIEYIYLLCVEDNPDLGQRESEELLKVPNPHHPLHLRRRIKALAAGRV